MRQTSKKGNEKVSIDTESILLFLDYIKMLRKYKKWNHYQHLARSAHYWLFQINKHNISNKTYKSKMQLTLPIKKIWKNNKNLWKRIARRGNGNELKLLKKKRCKDERYLEKVKEIREEKRKKERNHKRKKKAVEKNQSKKVWR